MRRKIMIVGVAALVVAGGGAAFAATKAGSPQEERKAVIEDAAKQLGVTPAKLSSALKKALENRVDAAVAAGRLTKEQGEALKKGIESQDYPSIGRAGFGFGGFGHRPGRLIHGFGFWAPGTAAKYLGVTQDELRKQLADGKSLADVAKAKGKSVDGLVTALLADTKKRLDAAVSDGKLTRAKADELYASAKKHTTDLVNAKRPPGAKGDKSDNGAKGKSRFGGAGPLWSGRPHHRRATI